MDKSLESFIMELKNRNYARNTIKAYKKHIKDFIAFGHKHPNYEPADRIMRFVDSCSDSSETKRIAVNAIKLFYKIVVKKECPYNLVGIRLRKRLPCILTKKEIISILSTIRNQKHYLLIALLYSSGLRVSEVVNLFVRDVILDKLSLHIKDSKQHKDRITTISEKTVKALEELIKGRKPGEYLFLTRNNNKYKIRTVQSIFKWAAARAGITKKASCHTLRHSFATHLLETGVDIKSIKNLLGHKSVKTTMVYIHLTDALNKRVKSPL